MTEFHDGEQYLSLGYTTDGLVRQAEDEPEYSTIFSYNHSGRPLQASFGDGTIVNMEYDGLGLRRKQDYGSGGRVDYWYDPAGNLTEIKVTNADGSQHGQKLVLDGSYQIVKQTLSNGVEYTSAYDKNGNLIEVSGPTSVTRFEYDALNRLTAVVRPQGQRLTYSYAPGERSLVARYDHGASLSAADRRDTGLTFATYWDVSATRSLASQFGAVRHSEALGIFQLSGTDGKEIATAEGGVLSPLEKLRLYDYGVPLDDRIREFQKPSNLMFLPPEYSSVNCCPLCNPGDECPPCDPSGAEAPLIDSIAPSRGLKGTAVEVNITGSGFGTHPTVNAGSNITVTYLFRNDTQILVLFNISASATAGSRTITVNAPGGSTTGSFFVQVPTKLVRLDLPGAPGGVGPLVTITNGNVVDLAGNILLTNRCGVYRNVAYDLVDQAGQPISATYDLTETFDTYSTTISPSPGTPEPLTTEITPGFAVMDTQFMGFVAPSCPGSNDHESFRQHFTVSVGTASYTLSTVMNISRGKFTGTYKVDVTFVTP